MLKKKKSIFSLKLFVESGWNFVACDNKNILFSSRSKNIEPILEFLESGLKVNTLYIYDKYIGRAAALLLRLPKPTKIFTPIISRGGKAVLESAGIEFEAKKEVQQLMGIASEGMCRFEKMSLGKDPHQFLTELQLTLDRDD